MSWIYIKKYSMNFDQNLQRHGRGIELSKHITILVTFDLHSRSRDPRWPPNTFFKVKFWPKTTHNSANFWSKFNNFCFVLLLETSSPLWMEKQYQQWFHVSFGSRETTLLYYSSLLWKIALSPFSTENDGKIDPNCHSATFDIFAMTYKCF